MFQFRYKFFVILLIVSLLGVSRLEAQVLKDTSSLNLIKNAVTQIYSARYRDAELTCNIIGKKYPDHPVVFLLKGMIIYWENYPLMSATDASRGFEDQMRLCIDKSEDYDIENEAEFLLASLCARGSLLAYYVGNDLQSKVFALGRTSYRYLRRSFEFSGIFPDFYFFTGLYNYYREAYPEANPVYKPLFTVFPRGDRVRGLYQLRIAFKESIFLKAEASTFLSSIYKYYENNFGDASYFSRAIYKDYPLNLVYRLNTIEDLLLREQYDEAEKLIEYPVSKTNNGYYIAQLMIFRGILYEKKYHDMVKAGKEYSAGIDSISEYGNYGEQHAAYAYFGLSRISGFNKDEHNQRAYRRKALNMTSFGNISFDK
jgi:hypothetical protein